MKILISPCCLRCFVATPPCSGSLVPSRSQQGEGKKANDSQRESHAHFSQRAQRRLVGTKNSWTFPSRYVVVVAQEFLVGQNVLILTRHRRHQDNLAEDAPFRMKKKMKGHGDWANRKWRAVWIDNGRNRSPSHGRRVRRTIISHFGMSSIRHGFQDGTVCCWYVRILDCGTSMARPFSNVDFRWRPEHGLNAAAPQSVCHPVGLSIENSESTRTTQWNGTKRPLTTMTTAIFGFQSPVRAVFTERAFVPPMRLFTPRFTRLRSSVSSRLQDRVG